MKVAHSTGSQIDFELLYREEGKRLWRAVFLYSGDPELASDAVSEAFAQAIRRGVGVRSPRAWVWRASFRIAAGELKRSRRTMSPEADVRYEVSTDSIALVSAMRMLSSKQRAAVILKYYGGYKDREIAQLIGSTTSAVGVHLHRARKRLRQLIGDQHD